MKVRPKKNRNSRTGMIRFLFLWVIMLAIFMACDDKDFEVIDDNQVKYEENNIYEGVFLDSPVQGIQYKTDTLVGVTDINGTFQYRDKETITFYIGDVVLGSTRGVKKLITPIDLVENAVYVKHFQVNNICRFLQSLDLDGNPENGIYISPEIREQVEGLYIDFTSRDFAHELDVQRLFFRLNDMGLFGAQYRYLRSADQAWRHFKASFLNYTDEADYCSYVFDDMGQWMEKKCEIENQTLTYILDNDRNLSEIRDVRTFEDDEEIKYTYTFINEYKAQRRAEFFDKIEPDDEESGIAEETSPKEDGNDEDQSETRAPDRIYTLIYDAFETIGSEESFGDVVSKEYDEDANGTLEVVYRYTYDADGELQYYDVYKFDEEGHVNIVIRYDSNDKESTVFEPDEQGNLIVVIEE